MDDYGEPMTLSRYVVGIDLGTTNSALAYVDTGVEGEPALQYLNIAQVVQPGVVDNRTLLPSFLYLPGPGEQPAGSLKLPWAPERDFAVGEFARVFGSQVPTRLVASAKSWLCHAGIDRRQPVLPWKAPESGRHVSPLEASTYYLKHLVEAWNHVMANVAGKEVAEHRLENQDIILTVPASFDAVARRIPTQSAKHVRGRRVYGGTRQFLPLRVNQAGVMPVIFASSLLILPMFVFKWANQQFGGSFFMNLTSSLRTPGLSLQRLLHRADLLLLLLLDGHHLQSQGHGQQPQGLRQLHSRLSSRQTHRRLSGTSPVADHLCRSRLPRGRRHHSQLDLGRAGPHVKPDSSPASTAAPAC